MNSNRKTSIAVALLFLSSTAAFMVGSGLIQSYFTNEIKDQNLLHSGLLLEAYCGLAVFGIGLLMYPILKNFHQKLALTYIVFRFMEFLVILGFAYYIHTTLEFLTSFDLIIFAFSSLAGLVFSSLLYISKIIPKSLSIIGLIGYACLLLGVLLNLLSIININEGFAILVYLPGTIFEFFLPILLLVKGFKLSED
ncbi:DUF4386 domain-containing protein [bacterium]|nr:DUF4386 domain-containing protein [bacterium]